MNIQKTAWGQIEWLVGDESMQQLNQILSIGIATINPHVSQESHIHYENEQFIYIIQGSGIDVINGESHGFTEGLFYYMPSNITHQLINTGDIAVRHILVSVSTTLHEATPYGEMPDIENPSRSLCAAIEAIRGQIVNSSLPIMISDDMGNVLLQCGKYPDYCAKHCHPASTPAKCPCFQSTIKSVSVESYKNVGAVCPYGLTVFQMPIKYKNHFLGNIFSGHILLGNEDRSKKIDMYDTPAGTMLAIQKWVADIAKSIVGFCSFDSLRNNLNQKNHLIEQKQRDQQALEANLQAMQNTVTNLKINRHFLFNTLNAIAGQALTGNVAGTYQSIVDLSKMFRYSTSVDLKLVSLREEIDYLQTYLHMQKLRYGDSLNASINCPDEAMNGWVPFNFLQPVVENAFTHGFADMAERKSLMITIYCLDNQLCFQVQNNGSVIDEITIKRVLSGMGSNSGHGLSLVYSKLKKMYNDQFFMDLTSNESEGTKINIVIPFQKK